MLDVNSSWPGCAIRVLPDGGRSFDLADRELSWIRVDYQARLQFGDAELVIETPFELRVDERADTLDPNDRAGLGPLLSLYPGTNIEVTMAPEGTLWVTFVGGASLIVPPHPKYEAWSIAGFCCTLGGFSATGP